MGVLQVNSARFPRGSTRSGGYVEVLSARTHSYKSSAGERVFTRHSTRRTRTHARLQPACTHAHKATHTHACRHAGTQAHACMHAGTRMHACTQAHACTHACMQECTHMQECAIAHATHARTVHMNTSIPFTHCLCTMNRTTHGFPDMIFYIIVTPRT